MSRLLTAIRRAQRGLDAGRASAMLLLSGECQLGSGLHAHSESLTDLMFVSGLLLDEFLDGVRDWCLLHGGCVGHIAAERVTEFRCIVRKDLRIMSAA